MKKGILYAVLASVLWAIVNPFIKQGLSYDFSPMNFAGLRFTVVGIILFAYTWHRGMWREIMQHRRLFGNLILINMFMGYTAFSFGVDFVSGAISSIVMGLTPLINVLLAHLVASNDRLNRRIILRFFQIENKAVDRAFGLHFKNINCLAHVADFRFPYRINDRSGGNVHLCPAFKAQEFADRHKFFLDFLVERFRLLSLIHI